MTVTRFDPDSAFLGIVLGYGATLMGYIYYGVPLELVTRQVLDRHSGTWQVEGMARYWGKRAAHT